MLPFKKMVLQEGVAGVVLLPPVTNHWRDGGKKAPEAGAIRILNNRCS